MLNQLPEDSNGESNSRKRMVDSRILEEIELSYFTLEEVISSYKEFEKLIWKCRRMVTDYAKKNSHFLKLNPNEKKVHELLVGLARNKIDFGYHFCPCMVMRICGDPAENRKRICPCYWHKKDIELDGACECGMFVKA
jgi:ferredoxin-thioredoxin reductase catalytic subunit